MSHQPYTATVTLANSLRTEKFTTLWHHGVGHAGELSLNLYQPDKGMTHVVYAPGTWLRLDYA